MIDVSFARRLAAPPAPPERVPTLAERIEAARRAWEQWHSAEQGSDERPKRSGTGG